MDLGRGLSFVRHDPNWLVKTLLGSIISFVPVLNFAATGYQMDVIRNVYSGQETPLPEWGDNFGDRWVRGLVGNVIMFLYALPLVLIGCGLGLVVVGSSAALEQTQGVERSFAPFAVLCTLPALFVVALLLGTLGMVAQARYAVTNDFSSAVRVGEIVRLWRRGIGQWLGVLLATIGAAIPFLIAGMLTCGLGYLVVFYPVLATSHWMAQTYAWTEGRRELAAI